MVLGRAGRRIQLLHIHDGVNCSTFRVIEEYLEGREHQPIKLPLRLSPTCTSVTRQKSLNVGVAGARLARSPI